MLKVILIGGLVVSLFSFFHNGGFQNRGSGILRRPSTRYGPPGAWNNESSTEPYFRIILSSNETATTKMNGSTIVKNSINPTGQSTTIEIVPLKNLPSNPNGSKSPETEHFYNFTLSTTVVYENTTVSLQVFQIQNASTVSTVDQDKRPPPTSSTLPVSSILVESTTTDPPTLTTTEGRSSTFTYENKTSPWTTTTHSSVLIESTNAVYYSFEARPIAQAQSSNRKSEPTQQNIETVTEAAYIVDNIANAESKFGSRPSDHFIPPPSKLNLNKELSIDSRNLTATDRNIPIPPAFYLPPRVQQLPYL